MYDSDLIVGGMRVRVGNCWFAVGCPASVGNTNVSFSLILARRIDSFWTLPTALTLSILLVFCCSRAIPAESYPRYSRRFRPSNKMPDTFLSAIAPTIPLHV